MGPVRATAMVVGTIIGASIFVQPSLITERVPSVPGIVAVWAVAGVLTLCGALVCAELASAFPASGGVYVFLREAYGPSVGFLWGWAMFWSMHSGIVAAISIVFSRYAAHFVPMDPVVQRVAAVAAILGLSGVNYVGVRAGSAVQTTLTAAKVLAVVAIVAVGFVLGARLDRHFVGLASASAPAPGFSLSGFLLALVAGLFAFGGWHMVTYTAEEIIEPERTVPRALWIGTLVVTACYVALNAVYLYVLPLDRVITSRAVAAEAADAVLGSGGAAVMAAVVIVSTLGALSGIILTGPRVYYSMARDGLLFGWLGEVHPRFRTPHRAIALQALWASALVATGTYQALFSRVVYTEWIFFGMMALGLVLLRRRAAYAAAYRVWGFPAVPALFAVASGAIVLNQIAAQPGESAFGLLLVLLGLPAYGAWNMQRRKVARRP